MVLGREAFLSVTMWQPPARVRGRIVCSVNATMNPHLPLAVAALCLVRSLCPSVLACLGVATHLMTSDENTNARRLWADDDTTEFVRSPKILAEALRPRQHDYTMSPSLWLTNTDGAEVEANTGAKK